MRAPVLREALVVMAKAPRVGHVKTRLAGALGAERATALYECLLRDTFAMVATVCAARSGLSAVLCFTPDDAATAFDGLVAPDVARLAQRGDGLGERLVSAFRDVLARGAESVVVIGADSPTLPASTVGDAFDALAEGVDVALGPTVDGGYYVIGARRVHETLFDDIPWSTDRVWAATLDRARQASLDVRVLHVWYDVDEPADLDRLRADLMRADGCDATRTFFRATEP